ncbi:MAG: ATP-binding protein, partial [Campylobacter sp.]|nr:ATP-binding protein [Campylobacter sp.]
LLPRSSLMSCEIFKSYLSYSTYNNIDDCFVVIDDDFIQNMFESSTDIQTLFKSIFKKCSNSELKFDDFDYLELNETNLKEYVGKCKKGTNILIYGVPGTGKTEFVKTFAKSIRKELFEVIYSDQSHESLDGNERLSRLRVSDRILNPKTSLIMFDEVEDLFKNSKVSKALINRTLEENLVSTFWITNDINQIDNAYIRRFDMILEFKIPPKRKRSELIKRYTQGQISDQTAQKLAKNKLISPALISSATKVISNLSTDDKDGYFKEIIKNKLKAQGYLKKDKKKKDEKQEITLPKSYDISYVNADVDLKKLTQGIKTSGNARLCIYGTAGTGKSAYAKFVAKSINKKIIIKKASDLIDCFVGRTEQNIAKAFKEAKEQNAVLVFDEVDTFLQDRGSALRSWEISQVNEMLTQMDSFEGIFIATTNLIDSLDKASIRRFDMKLEFGYLKPKQALKFFTKECNSLNLDVSSEVKNRLLRLTLLTPGDFAAVIRANKFSPISSADEFANSLAMEIKYKDEDLSAKRVGFAS